MAEANSAAYQYREPLRRQTLILPYLIKVIKAQRLHATAHTKRQAALQLLGTVVALLEEVKLLLKLLVQHLDEAISFRAGHGVLRLNLLPMQALSLLRVKQWLDALSGRAHILYRPWKALSTLPVAMELQR